MLYIGIILFFLLEYIRPSDDFPILKVARINTIWPILLFIVSLFSSGLNSYKEISKNKNFLFFVIYIFLFLISIFTARLSFNAFTIFKGVLGYVFIYFVLAKNIDTYDKLMGIFKTLIIIHILVLIRNPQVILEPQVRHFLQAGYFFGDGNDFALSVCIVFPMSFYLYRTSTKKIKKWIWLGITIILLLSIIGTQSRGGTLGLVAIAIYLWLTSKKKIFGLILLSIGFIVVIFIASNEYMGRMQTITEYENDSSAQQRLMAWGAGFRMALDNPVTGIGAGGYASAYGQLYRPPGYGPRDLKWSNAHSIYFLLLGELGFPGLIMLLLFIFWNIYKNHQNIHVVEQLDTSNILKRELFLTINASIIGFAVGGAFLTASYYPHLYVIVGLSAATDILVGKNQNNLN